MRRECRFVHRFIALLLVAQLIGSSANAETQTAAGALKQLEAAIQKELASRPSPAPDRAAETYGRPDGARMLLAQVESAISSGETSRVEELLSQLPAYLTSEEVRTAATALRASLKQERESRQAASVAEVTAALRQAADAVHTATVPEELDEALRRLDQFRTTIVTVERNYEPLRIVSAKVEPTLTFLKSWQDYLAARKNNNAERTRQSLQQLLNYSVPDIMPRSQILAELEKYPATQEMKVEPPQPEQIERLVAETKSLDDLPQTIRRLQQYQSGGHSYPASELVNATLGTLVSLERTYREFQAGLPTKLEGPSNYTRDLTSPAVTPLKAKLLLLVLPRYLNAPSDITPGPTETVQEYLERALDDARARGHTELATRVRDVQKFLTTGVHQNTPEPAGLMLVNAGNNQELAGQFMLAVISYQNALRNGGDAVPAKAIGERLAAIRAAHPREYEDGMAAFLGSSDPKQSPRILSPQPSPSPGLPIPGATAGK